jgi:hypothetical protein
VLLNSEDHIKIQLVANGFGFQIGIVVKTHCGFPGQTPVNGSVAPKEVVCQYQTCVTGGMIGPYDFGRSTMSAGTALGAVAMGLITEHGIVLLN